jgi:putative transcriptional regulator
MQIILYDLRKNEKRMTQQEIADYLGIAVQTYRLKEKGEYEFTQDEMFMLAELFNKNINEIFLPRKHRNGNKQLI